jgi:predicted dehydrogenase
MLRVGIVGIGFMGMIHYLAYQRAQGVKVVAICSRNEKKRRGDWRGIQGNFGPPGQMMDLSGITAYAELDELLADGGVDLVDVCLPPAEHAGPSIAALRAGKHVFCEKPIAVTEEDAVRMVDAAKAADRQLLIGQVLPFFPEYDFALRTVQSGQYGRLLGGHFKRIISNPAWLTDFFDPVKVGGPVVDLHVHDAHFIRLICGMPEGVFSTGRLHGAGGSSVESSPESDVVEFVNTQFLFRDRGLNVTAASGVLHQQGRAFTHAFEIYLERAALLFDFAVIDGQPVTATPLTVLTSDDRVLRPELGSGDPVEGFVREVTEVARSIQSGQPSPLLAGDLARDALLLCHRQSESVRSREIVWL